MAGKGGKGKVGGKDLKRRKKETEDRMREGRERKG